MIRHRSAALSAVAAALAVAGCTATTTASDNGSAAGSSSKKLKVGITVQTFTNPFFVAEADGAKAEVERLNGQAFVEQADQNVQKQSDQIDAFIRRRVDVIVVDAVDSNGIGPAVARAKAAGITVVAIDVGADGADATVTTDNVQAGRIACEHLGERVRSGPIAILDGTNITAVNDRIEGCLAALKAYPDIKVVARQRGLNSRDSALPIATNMLTANPGIKGFFAINDPTAAGVELAAKQKGRTDVVIASVDGARAAVESITRGGLIGCTSAQDPRGMGAKGAAIGMQLAAGKPPSQTTVLVPATLVTKDNAASYTPWG
ncbi:cytochrome c [Actinomadura rubrobrunea]|uniref:Cytochrome c n=1 Tax=Actinomadura rubrobrunea TaxID=115335 RepID=A0A9W6USS3_9ACTN|nr:substrate-binding domain-containing protein [Actinomadura rubrobrunea]GLW61909.1 cytochrome c [Actinomadura rubrobrunea]